MPRQYPGDINVEKMDALENDGSLMFFYCCFFVYHQTFVKVLD